MRVNGVGPIPADLMIIGEAPGELEERFGRPFVGPSGDELDALLQHAGIDRRRVRIRNVLDTRPPGNRDPLPAEIDAARPGLWAEIARVQPVVIVTVGRFATHELLPPYPMEYCQGLAFDHPRGFRVYPVFHPAYALRKPSIFVPLYEAFAKLERVLDGTEPSWQETRAGSYHAMTAQDTLESPCLALDTEGSGDAPWGLTWSSTPGQGVAVKVGDMRNLRRVQRMVTKAERVYLHESLGDLHVLNRLGIHVPPAKITDSLILAFLLGTTAGELKKEGESKVDRKALGLKLLGFRLAGLHMRPFKAVMGPLDAKAVRAWIERQLTRQRDPQVAKALGRCYLAEDPRASLRRSKFTKDLEVPAMVIPWHEDMIHYACMDADATRRIGPVLEQRIAAAGLERIAAIDHGVIPLVSQMQGHGLLVDGSQMNRIRIDMLAEEQEIEARVVAQAWPGFNPRSHEQMGHLLYDWLDLPVVKRSRKTGARSTDEKALAQLHHTVIDDLMDLRELRKLRSTYVEVML